MTTQIVNARYSVEGTTQVPGGQFQRADETSAQLTGREGRVLVDVERSEASPGWKSRKGRLEQRMRHLRWRFKNGWHFRDIKRRSPNRV